MSRLLFTKMKIHEVPCLVSALEEAGKILELNFVREQKKSILGNIYVGQVQNLVSNIQAAFIQIQNGLPCYYSLREQDTAIYAQERTHEKLVPGDQVLVQVSREAMKGKATSVTTRLNFTGTYLVLTTDSRKIAFSSKLDADSKERLGALLSPLLDGTFGMIVRTNAKEGTPEQILQEFRELKTRLERVLSQGKNRRCFSLLDEAEPFCPKILHNTYTEGLEEIVTDDPQIYLNLQELLHMERTLDISLLRFYEDSLLPLYKLYRLETALEEIASEKVWLKSGGYLVIQQTEAFVSIDVNSGKFAGKKKAEETYRKINLEAAAQIARQLRLRNLSGIILIDFINMDNSDHKEELLHVLQKYLRKDPVKGVVVDMTKLNIVEVTRKKVRRPLFEDLSELREETVC